MKFESYSEELLSILSQSNIVIGNEKLSEHTELLQLLEELIRLHDKYNGDSYILV